MDALPAAAQRRQIDEEYALNPGQLTVGKPIVLPQRKRARWTIQFKDRFVAIPDDMHMSRAVVIWINRHPQSANPQNGWHRFILT
jgi:hypothetical protein